MGNNPVPKFIFRLSMFPVYRGSVLGRFYCMAVPSHIINGGQETCGQRYEVRQYCVMGLDDVSEEPRG